MIVVNRITMKRHRKNAGVVMFEVLIAGTILSVGLVSAMILIPTTAKLEQSNSSEEIGRMVLQRMVDELYEMGTYDAFRTYNDFGADDPDGEDTAPGSRFEMPPFEAVHPDGFVGRITFPTHTLQNDNKTVQMDETVDVPVLGMPRDLDGDGKRSKSTSANDLIILPVRVSLDWKSAAGDQHLEAVIVLGPR